MLFFIIVFKEDKNHTLIRVRKEELIFFRQNIVAYLEGGYVVIIFARVIYNI